MLHSCAITKKKVYSIVFYDPSVLSTTIQGSFYTSQNLLLLILCSTGRWNILWFCIFDHCIIKEVIASQQIKISKWNLEVKPWIIHTLFSLTTDHFVCTCLTLNHNFEPLDHETNLYLQVHWRSFPPVSARPVLKLLSEQNRLVVLREDAEQRPAGTSLSPPENRWKRGVTLNLLD